MSKNPVFKKFEAEFHEQMKKILALEEAQLERAMKGDIAPISRLFDDLKFSPDVNKAAFKFIYSTNDLKGNLKKLTDEMSAILFTEGIQGELKPLVKKAIGEKTYTTLISIYGKTEVHTSLWIAAFTTFHQAAVMGAILSGGEITNPQIPAAIQEYTTELSRAPINKLELLSVELSRSINKLTSYKAQNLRNLNAEINSNKKWGLVLKKETPDSSSIDRSKKIADLEEAIQKLTQIKEKIDLKLVEAKNNGKFIKSSETLQDYSAQIKTVITDTIKNKSSLSELHGWGERLLNLIKKIVTLGQEGYVPETLQAVRGIEKFSNTPRP